MDPHTFLTDYAVVRTLSALCIQPMQTFWPHPCYVFSFVHSELLLQNQNNLPLSVESSCSYDVFKCRLKSHLFVQVFTWPLVSSSQHLCLTAVFRWISHLKYLLLYCVLSWYFVCSNSNVFKSVEGKVGDAVSTVKV